MSENNIENQHEHIFGLWIDTNDGHAKRCCLVDECNYEEKLSIDNEIERQLKEQYIASQLWEGFCKVSNNDPYLIQYINMLLVDEVPYLDMEKKKTLATRMEEVMNLGIINESNQVFFRYLIPILQKPQANSTVYWEVMEEYENYNQKNLKNPLDQIETEKPNHHH